MLHNDVLYRRWTEACIYYVYPPRTGFWPQSTPNAQSIVHVNRNRALFEQVFVQELVRLLTVCDISLKSNDVHFDTRVFQTGIQDMSINAVFWAAFDLYVNWCWSFLCYTFDVCHWIPMLANRPVRFVYKMGKIVLVHDR